MLGFSSDFTLDAADKKTIQRRGGYDALSPPVQIRRVQGFPGFPLQKDTDSHARMAAGAAIFARNDRGACFAAARFALVLYRKRRGDIILPYYFFGDELCAKEDL
jgi:hypothetical protein